MPTGRVEPILPAKNLDETRAFYMRLGFTPWFGGQTWSDYEILSSGELVMHFFAAPALVPGDNQAGCYWRVASADHVYQECAAQGLPLQGIPRLEPICDQPWGMREFVLVDPSGNLVRVGHQGSSNAASPGAVVQRQLDAYNARDLSAFLATYARDATQFELHGACLAAGHEQIRQRMATRFAEPGLHAELLSRVVMGSVVVDHERVTRNLPEGKGTIEMLCVYEVVDGLIARASFALGPRQTAPHA